MLTLRPELHCGCLGRGGYFRMADLGGTGVGGGPGGVGADQEVLGADQEPLRTPSLLIFIQITLATQKKAAAAPP